MIRSFKILSQNNLTFKRGLTVVEIIIDLAIISTIGVALLSLMIANLRSAAFAQMKVIASNLGNQKIEEIRNMPYSQIGISGSPVPGNLLKDQTLTFAGYTFNLHTQVVWVDDPYDGVGAADTDPDYKKVTLSLTQSGKANPVLSATTNISSKASETPGNTGILYVAVKDGSNPDLMTNLEAATVTVTNTSVTPNINISGETDANGIVIIPLLPPDSHYSVKASKAGYSDDLTIPTSVCTNLPNSPEATQDPTILVQNTTAITLQIRCNVNLLVNVNNTDGSPRTGNWIRVHSTRRKCKIPEIFKLDQWVQTDTNGRYDFGLVESDKYIYTNE